MPASPVTGIHPHSSFPKPSCWCGRLRLKVITVHKRSGHNLLYGTRCSDFLAIRPLENHLFPSSPQAQPPAHSWNSSSENASRVLLFSFQPLASLSLPAHQKESGIPITCTLPGDLSPSTASLCSCDEWGGGHKFAFLTPQSSLCHLSKPGATALFTCITRPIVSVFSCIKTFRRLCSGRSLACT